MIFAIPEYDDFPSLPDQWLIFYHTLNDIVYVQTLTSSDPGYPNWEEKEQGAAIRDDMRHEITLTQSRYIAKDYQTFLDETLAYIREQWGDSFNDFMTSEPAMMILEYIAAAFDAMSWQVDREVDELYMELARVRSNVARLARYLGYKPDPAVASSVDLLVTLTDGPYAFNVTLYKGHQFGGPNGLIFELGSDQTILASETTKTIGVYQGQTYNETFISDGSANQQFNLSLVPEDENVSVDSCEVYVDLVEWTEYDFLPYGAEQAFEVSYLTVPPVLKFGDGIIGAIPTSGAEIKVSYVSTKGKTGGLATTNTVTTNITPVVVNFQNIPVSVNNALPSSGGFDAESIESIKANAPQYFLTAERLVTQGDYETLAGQFVGTSGGISKANAVIIRGVDGDLELQSLMDEVTGNTDSLDGYLDNINNDQDAILGYTGAVATSGTIRNVLANIDSQVTFINSEVTSIGTLKGTVSDSIDNGLSDIELAQTKLDFIPFQEVVGYGDGSTTVFAKTLSKRPITEGSLTVMVSDPTAENSGTNGDCDSTPGRLIVTMTTSFVAGDRGKAIQIGGEYRQIIQVVSGTTIEYSGSRIYGTSLLVYVYSFTIVGYDDGAGSVVGAGLSGTINYTTGQLAVTMSSAPDGISGKFGTPIIVSYQYQSDGIKGTLDNAITDIDSAKTSLDGFVTYGSNISGYTSTINTDTSDIGDVCDNIDISANGSKSDIILAKNIPVQMQNDIDDVMDYLDTVISGDCKSNVVRVSVLTVDSNGFYIAPSVALMQELKTYLDERKIRTVQNSVVSGSYYLVKVKLDIELSIDDQYVFQTVSEDVSDAIDKMFKGREYEQPLLRSEYYGVVDAVDGVSYSNISISDVAYVDSNNTEDPPDVDVDGNLFIADYEVITKWSVNITQI